jgi:DNA-binding FadR family transcriptional regulator
MTARKPTDAKLVTPYKPARRMRLPDQLYEQILRQIIDGQMVEGQKLPTEHQMSQLFQVSRPVVREALFRLQADGLVEAVQGSGTYVRRRPDPGVVQLAPEGQIADILRCFELRIALEGEAAYYAAERCTASDIKAIRDTYQKLESATEDEQLGVSADMEFHRMLLAAAHNELFTVVFDNMTELMEAGLTVTRSLSLRGDVSRRRTVQAEHMAILSAVVERRAEDARLAARTHLENARQRLVTKESQVATQRLRELERKG